MTVFPPGWRRIPFASLDSTNTALKRLIADGTRALHEGVFVTAESQSAGRGRQGRAWVSPVGNLYASFLLDAPEQIAIAPQIGFVAAVAVVDALATPGVRLRCKWPNDVLADGAKVCGILPELAGTWIVLGIGVNLQPVNVQSDYPTSSLAEQGARFTTDQALAAISRTLARRLDQWRVEGFAPIAAAWTAVGPAKGEAVRVRLPAGAAGGSVVSGAFIGLDGEGALMLNTETGHRRIVAGDVLFAADQAEAS